jgi:glutathione synthase/RimK-type ligase-like ATP-grasp enzyme
VLSIKPERLHLLKPTRFIINWGSSENERFSYRCKILNRPESVLLSSNKLNTFHTWSLDNVSCPEWTTDIDIARQWIEEGSIVFCRTRLQSHSGNGIVIAESNSDLVPAPLYTKYIKKKKEFRVHVFNNEVIDVQEKRRSMDSNTGFLIRNHANGFVFCRDNLIEPRDLRAVATHAVRALGLDFGAVDIIWNEHYNRCYALEVNTAPGLEGTTLQTYINKFIEVAYG